MLKSFKTNQPIFRIPTSDFRLGSIPCVIKDGQTEEQKVPWSVRFHVWMNGDSSKIPHPSIAPFSFGEALVRMSHFGGQMFSWDDS